MIPFFQNRRAAANRDVIDRLNETVIGAVRAPVFYLAGGVPDTFNGRFELLVLHCALTVRQLKSLPEPGPSMAQALTDTVFRYLDPAMRELGVGDLAVPKRMKKLAEAYLGRSTAYDEALTSGDRGRLEAALVRNIYGGGEGPAARLGAYVLAAAAGLGSTPIEVLGRGELVFPDPAAFLMQSGAA